MADLVADDAREAVDAVGFFRPLRHAPLEREPLWRVAAGGDDRARRGEHPRAGNDALVDGLLQLHVGVARAFGTEIANGREAGDQCRAEMSGGARDAEPEAFVHHLVVPGRLVVRMQQHV